MVHYWVVIYNHSCIKIVFLGINSLLLLVQGVKIDMVSLIDDLGSLIEILIHECLWNIWWPISNVFFYFEVTLWDVGLSHTFCGVHWGCLCILQQIHIQLGAVLWLKNSPWAFLQLNLWHLEKWFITNHLWFLSQRLLENTRVPFNPWILKYILIKWPNFLLRYRFRPHKLLICFKSTLDDHFRV